MPNSAPISPSRSVSNADHAWVAPSLNITPAVSKLASSIVQEDFTFPEFNEDGIKPIWFFSTTEFSFLEFNDSPLKSAPVTTAAISSSGPVKSTTAAEKPIHSGGGAESFRLPSDSVANQVNILFLI